VNRQEWLAARKQLLAREAEVADANAQLAASIRSLPMTKVDKDYRFGGPDGAILSLADLFSGQDQLIVYHFMFAPESAEGCRGCAFMADHIPDIRHLACKGTAVACVSRAPIVKIDAWKKKIGWTFPWYSSSGSDFNYDFNVTIDANSTPADRGLGTTVADELAAHGLSESTRGDIPGFSFFLKRGGAVYHTYTTHTRVIQKFMTTLQLLDLTVLGRQEGPMGPAEFKLRHEY
jgi:predicted dithiol-disulfide oxidoreductase (DUF899 family)